MELYGCTILSCPTVYCVILSNYCFTTVYPFYLITCQTWTDLVMMPHVRFPDVSELTRTRLGFEHSDWLLGKLSFIKLSECIGLAHYYIECQSCRRSCLTSWEFLPSGAKKCRLSFSLRLQESLLFWAPLGQNTHT